MNRILLCFFACFFCSYAFAQLPTNSVAPNWTLTDLNGVEHTLYDYLDDGKVVFIKFSATWCGPCWNYHQGGAFSDIYYDYGPDGTDEAMVFFLEADPNTNTDCLYGLSTCNSNTLGDWVTGTPYPIIDLPNASVRIDYQVNAYPTVFSICPDTRIVRPWPPGGPSKSLLETVFASCGMDAEITATGEEQCYGDQEGFIEMDMMEGHGNISYSWSNGASTKDLYNIGIGTYSVTITDGNDREIYLNDIEINGPEEELTYEISEVVHNLCAYDGEGSITTSTSGGTPGYSYLWNTGSTDPNLTNLDGGSYSLTITDANDCVVETPAIDILEPEELFMFPDPSNENCGMEDGEIFIFVEGGTPNYSFDIGLGPIGNPYFPNLSAGEYTVVLTDANGCEKLETVTIENIPPPVADAGEDFDFPCDEPTALLDGSGSSGAGTLAYEWTTEDGNIVEGEDSPNPTIDMAGSYLLVVTNTENGCMDFSLVNVIPDPNAPEAVVAAFEALDCEQTELTLDGSGSSSGSGITYQWTTSNGNIVEGANTAQAVVDQAGTYTLVVTHQPSSCVASTTVTVESSAETVEIEALVSNILTCELNNAILSGQGSAEGANISYQWLNADGQVLSDELEIEVEESGTYTFEVFNADNGCVASLEINLEEDTELPQIEVSETSFLTCTESSVTISGEGSAFGDHISYQWTNEDGTEILGDELQLSVTTAGGYLFNVINGENGCIATASVEVEVDDDVPFADAGTSLELTCDNTTLNLDGSNSDEGDQFNYIWTTEEGEILEGENSLAPLIGAPGLYTLTVFNTENECEAQSTVEITEFIDTPLAGFEFNVNNLQVLLFDNSQTENYSRVWDFGDGTVSDETNPEHQFPEAGEYTICLTITNACGSDTHCETVEVSGAGISVSADIIDVSCHGGSDGSISVSASGNDPFDFSWNNGAEGSVLENVPAGEYEVEITDNSGFTISQSFIVQEPDPIEVYDVSVTGVTADAQGSVIINVRGGTPPFTFEWSNGATSQNLENIGMGEYTVTITDGNECVTVVGPFEVEDFSNTLELDGLVEFHVFPNPFGTSLTIDYAFETDGNTSIVIRDILGRVVFSESKDKNADRLLIESGHWAYGFYTVEISRDNGIAVKKLLRN